MRCVVCNKSVLVTELIACTDCRGQFHYHCAEITKAQYKDLSDSDKNLWQCQGCRNISRRTRSDDTPVGKSHKSARPAVSVTGAHQEEGSVGSVPGNNQCEYQQIDISSQLDIFKREMKEMIAVQGRELRQTLKEIQQSNASIESSVGFLTAQNEEYRKKIEQMEVQAKKDREQITMLEDRVEDLQRGNRKTCFEIKNVPKTNNETRDDLIKMVACLSKSVGCKIETTDIKDIYRVHGKKENKNSPIIVETASTIQKTDILKQCKVYNTKNKDKLRAKNLGFTRNEETSIFVAEQLTAKAARLFYLARDLAKTKSYKFCWTSFGRVFLRRDESTPKIRIHTEAQIHNLLQVE